jgi:membrane fusion protein (multidrug efflux system)
MSRLKLPRGVIWGREKERRRNMRRRLWGSLIVIAVAVLAGGYWWFSQGAQLTAHDADTAAGQAESAQGPVAPVEVAPIKEGTIAEEITVYGTIVPAAGAVQAITVPFESRVRRILVTEGQQVSRGDPLLEIEPSVETNLQTQQARNDYQSAQKALQYIQQRFDLKLATNDQLLQAQQALGQAQAKLESLRGRGSEGAQTVHAAAASLVSKVAIQEGAIVPAGNAMIELVAQTRLQARLGIEPADSSKVKAGQEVSLARINVPGTHAVIGRIRKLSQAANATSHLIDGFVDLPSASGFLLNEYVAGRISVGSAQGLVVPRSAVLPDADRYVLFTVKGGRAQEHTVQVRLANATEVEVNGKDLVAGEPVVTLGNYELKDGMAVKVEPSR